MKENLLGTYLRDRRTKLDPAALGFTTARRRTTGLRREEVAQRANVSVTWYTWLEQGRGGAPSSEVLERIAHALMMTDAEREHLFLLGLGRPPATRSQLSVGVSPRLQRFLDTFEYVPAMIKNCTWDILAWNKAASAIMVPFDKIDPRQRNTLRLLFLSPQARAAQLDWEGVARFAVGTLRADAARAGIDISDFVSELSRLSADFERFWNEHDVRSHVEGVKTIQHQIAGLLSFECSSFAVDGRPDLSMNVWVPATDADKNKVRNLVDSQAVFSEEELAQAGLLQATH